MRAERTQRVFCWKRMNQAQYWVCEESVHEESHSVGPAPIMCRTPAASVKATRRIPAFGDVDAGGWGIANRIFLGFKELG
jgi:hypothetical protein